MISSLSRIIKLIILAVGVSLSAAGEPALVVAPPNGHVHLTWSYDTNQLSTNLWFNWYETTNIATPLTNWNCITNVLASSITNISGTNLTISIDIVPGEHFLVGSSSNFWGETSITSQMAHTPPLPLPINDTTRIEKAP